MLARPTDIPIKAEPLSEFEYQSLKSSMPRWRDVLICKLLRNTGIRIAELLRLEPQHCYLDGPEFWILVVRGKRRKQPAYEKVWVRPELGVEMRDYIRGNRIASGPVFDISARWVQKTFNKAGETSIGRPVHPHELRGLFTRYMIENGVPVEAAAKMLGHEDYRTTQKYYYELTADKRRLIGERMPV